MPEGLRSSLCLTEVTRSLQTDSYSCAYGRAAMFLTIVNELQEAYSAFSYGFCTISHLKSVIDRFRNTLAIASAKKSCLSHVSVSSCSLQGRHGVDKSPMFVDVFHSFFEHKKVSGISERILKEYAFYFDVCKAVIGDKPIALVTRNDIKKALQKYSRLPRRNMGAYRKLAISDLLEMDVPSNHRVADKTVEHVKKMLHSLFVYAINDLEVLTESPVRNLNLKLKVNNTYAAYTDLEINKLLNACKDLKKPWQKWILLLGIYTGARRGELVKLHSTDVKLDEDTGRYYIMISDKHGSVKTENSIRQVPLHSSILSAGFIEFAEKIDGLLFPSLKLQQVTGWFSRLRDAQGIESSDDYGNRKVFHSLRHTLITKARAAGVDVVKVQQVVGHEKAGVGITDRYTHMFALNDVLEVVDSVRF